MCCDNRKIPQGPAALFNAITFSHRKVDLRPVSLACNIHPCHTSTIRSHNKRRRSKEMGEEKQKEGGW